MAFFNVLTMLGIVYIIMGIFAFFLNKYLYKKTTLEELERKYGVIDEKRLCEFEGLYYLILGGVFTVVGITNYIKPISHLWDILFVLLCLFLAIAYYPLRKKYLGIK